MADTKITGLTALTSIATGDLIPIVDISDTTDSVNGTTKKITQDNLIPDSSLTVKGKVELATSTEINTGTDTVRAMPVDQFVASNRNVRYLVIRVIASTTDWSVDGSTSVGGAAPVPITGTIVEIYGDSDIAGTTGTAIVDVNKNGTTIMTTNKLKWDSTEVSTRTYSGTAPGLTTTAITAGDLITVDIDTNHTTKSKGLTITLGIRQT